MTTEPNCNANELSVLNKDNNEDVYFHNLTPIHNAVSNSDTNILIELLKANKIDINAKSKNGYTALMLAADVDTEHLKILLDAGADIHARNPNLSTALFVAVKSFKHPLKNIQLLIEYGTQCNEFNGLKETPLSQTCLAMQKKQNTLKSNKVFNILLPHCDVTLEKDSLNPLLVNLLSDNFDKNIIQECIYKICLKACQDGKLDILERQAKYVKENYLISSWCENYLYKTVSSIRLKEHLDISFNTTESKKSSKKI